MKTRKGFVSNSSSSSYVVTINTDYDEFVTRLYQEYYFCFFNKKKIKNEIKREIKRLKKIKKAEEKSDHNEKFKSFSLNGIKESIKREQNNFKTICEIDKDNIKDLVEFVLKWYWIKLKKDEENITLSYFALMHNDFVEGINDLFKEIILFFMFDTDYKIKCYRSKNDCSFDINSISID